MESRSHTTGKLIWILLSFAFAACVIASLLQGATVYQRINSVLTEEYGVPTGLSYIQTRVRSADTKGGVRVGSFDGLSALVCPQTVDGQQYVTIIYCYDGSLRELFCQADADFTADGGETLMDMDSLTFSDVGDGLIKAECSCGTDSGSILLALRSEGGGGA